MVPVTIDEAVAAAVKVTGWMAESELRWLAKAASTRTLVAELGSWQGRSSKAMAGTVLGTLFCVDPWPTVSDKAGLEKHPELKAVPENVLSNFMFNLSLEIVKGRVRPVKMMSEHAVTVVTEILAGRKLDMVFIDGNHTYEGVCRDIRLWSPLLAKGGLMCGHDWNHEGWPGVVRAVTELLPGSTVAENTTIWSKEL